MVMGLVTGELDDERYPRFVPSLLARFKQACRI